MEQPPSSVALWVQWETPADQDHFDHIAAVLARQQRRSIGTRPALLYGLLIGVALVLPVALWPVGLIGPVMMAVVVLWIRFGVPRQMAESFRRQPTSREPMTVTFDSEGLHVVGPSMADHLRWKLFEGVSIDDGVLVFRRRGVQLFQAVSLRDLDPGVDRARLVAELERVIAASAPPA